MAARAEAEREDQPASSTPTRTSTAPSTRQGASEKTEVSLTQFRAQFPGLVSVGGEGGG